MSFLRANERKLRKAKVDDAENILRRFRSSEREFKIAISHQFVPAGAGFFYEKGSITFEHIQTSIRRTYGLSTWVRQLEIDLGTNAYGRPQP